MHKNENDFSRLHALVETAERERDRQNTTALQEYVDNHPSLLAMTIGMTGEVTQKLIFYLANADPKKEEAVQAELETLRQQIEMLSEKPNILTALLAEEIVISYLMVRCSDTMYSRHQSSLSSMALRRAESAHSRFLRSLKCLANLGKTTPFINFNIGTQQIVNG